ncbi:hypothetical protein HELRODRAFT_174119 [Helobdella robusta]|uniref:Peptidase S1 domain-containing protein n=1 Tax=Helobdella robusta TaxID=6412 RepID=T1F7N2_HELRO|nr:hypothetical protein HELRODRAFT_174119 [Helobdella robusta]ESO03220.1 hypothetical protein HELRODRAFT_174119 [Helobdella robusta]
MGSNKILGCHSNYKPIRNLIYWEDCYLHQTYLETQKTSSNDPIGNPQQANLYTAKVGTNTLYGTNVPTLKVDLHVFHPNFDTITNNYDIGLVKLSTRLNFTDYVQPICLPRKNYNSRELSKFDVCVATGFGKTEHYSSVSRFLLQGRMNIMTYEDCIRNLKRQVYVDESELRQVVVDDIMICAGSIPTYYEPNSCKGDSGSPYVCRDPNGIWTQVGITSFGVPVDFDKSCTNSIFTRVPAFIQFIHDTMSYNIK